MLFVSPEMHKARCALWDILAYVDLAALTRVTTLTRFWFSGALAQARLSCLKLVFKAPARSTRRCAINFKAH